MDYIINSKYRTPYMDYIITWLNIEQTSNSSLLCEILFFTISVKRFYCAKPSHISYSALRTDAMLRKKIASCPCMGVKNRRGYIYDVQQRVTEPKSTVGKVC